MSFQITTKWQQAVSDAQPSELDASLAQLLIKVGNKYVTEFRDTKRATSKHITIPAYPVAEWIAENWWALLWEPRKNEDDEPSPDFLSRHSLLAAQHGFALPRVWFVPIGRSLQISVASRDVALADVKFIHGASEYLAHEVVEKELRNFVDGVVGRLAEHNIRETYLQDAWQMVQETEPEEDLFCRLVGALGKSPYDVDDYTASLIERLLPTLGEQVLMDLCLASTATLFPTLAATAEKVAALTKDAEPSTLDPVGALPIPKDNATVPAYRRGVRAAELLRTKLSIKDTDPLGATRVFDAFHLDTGRRIPPERNDDEIAITGAVVRDDSHMKVALLQSTEAKRRFAGARAIFSAWSAEGQNDHRLLTSAVTRDQQANRAFAAELTAPRNLIRAKAKGGRLSNAQVYDLAGDLNIGPDVVKKQAHNNGIQVSPA